MHSTGGASTLGPGTRSTGAATRGVRVVTFGTGFTFRGQPILPPFHRHANHEPADNGGKWCSQDHGATNTAIVVTDRLLTSCMCD